MDFRVSRLAFCPLRERERASLSLELSWDRLKDGQALETFKE